MKKRKELNALIGLAADGRRKKPPKKGSGHRLLRTEPPASDSESSSEEDEFAVAGARGRCGKGDYLRCCKFCYPLCAFVILAACVVACVGLVWMQVALKEDLDAIKEKFRTMESNQKTSFQEIPKLNEDLLQKQKQLEQIETGELGLSKIWINITEINKQISLLTSTVNRLKNNIKSASDLISLPVTVEKLQKASTANVAIAKRDLLLGFLFLGGVQSFFQSFWFSVGSVLDFHCVISEGSLKAVPRVWNLHILYLYNTEKACGHLAAFANIGSTLTSVSHDVENIQTAIEEYKKSIEILQNDVGNDVTTSLKVENEDQLDNETHSNKEVKVKGAFSESFFFLHMQETGTRDSQVSKLREKLQLISALTGKPENDKPIETSKNVESSLSTTAKPTDLSRLASRSADDNTEDNRQLRHLSLPGINSIEDLQNLFEKATEDADGKLLSYEDLQKLLGSTAQESQSFKKYDTDGDEKYSLQELRLALGV
ncbi:EFC14 protein, partial [Nyctiprogne leucopyga]|nr:EFC14 protein [Nyctiprogne leucopyga]